MNAARKWIRPLYLAGYAAFLLIAFGWLPALAGGRPDGELLFGALASPAQAARIGAFAPVLLAAAFWLGGPRSGLGRALLLPLIGIMLVALGPVLVGDFLPLSNVGRVAFALLLVVPLLFFRRGEIAGEDAEPVALDVGTLLSGAGLTLALFALQSRLALFGYGEAAEVHLVALVLLTTATVGALAIGLPLAKGGRTLAALAAVVAAAGCWIGLSELAPLTTNVGLDKLLRGFTLDLSQLGQLEGGALIAGRALVVSGFALGALVVGLRTRRSLASFALGAAVARLAWPYLPANVFAAGMPRLVELGVWIAVAGALPLVLRRLRREESWRRLPAAIGLLALFGGTFLIPRHDAKPLSPWLKFEAKALFEADSPLGWLAVETTKSETPVLTINRIALTPDAHQEAADAARLVTALDLMAANRLPDDPNPDVLLAGQLTLPRLEAFNAWREASGLDATLHWSAPWEAAQSRIRAILEDTWPLPAPLPFAEATAKLGGGEFDLVVVPMAFGPERTSMSADNPPRAAAPAFLPAWRGAAKDQPAVVWLSAEAPLAAAALSERVLLSGSDLDHLGVGLVHLFDTQGNDSALFQTGAPSAGPCALGRLGSQPEMRGIHDRAELFARLSKAADAPFLSALASLLEAQQRSSPWAAPLERFELDGDQLEALASATPKSPSHFERLVWNHLAEVLVAKRMPAESLAVLPGLLDSTGRWAELEYALARAELELMLNEDAAKLLRRLFDEERLGPLPLVELGNCLGQLGDWAGASAAFERALTILPGLHAIERQAAMASARAGLPGSIERIRALVDEDPDDSELAAYLQPGPMPPAPSGFDPNPLWGGLEADH